MEESMKDFEEDINKSLEERNTYDDPDAGKWEVFEKMLAEKTVARVKIIEVVKGGCIAYLDEVRAFIPASQLSLKYVEDLDEYQSKSIDVIVINVEPEKKRLVLSHREIEKSEEDEKRKKALEALKVGDIVKGKVEGIKEYGAFVDIGDGVSGLLHVSQISNNRIKHPGVVLKEGDEIEVKITGVENGKVSLSKKVLETEKEESREKKAFENFKHQDRETATTSLAALLKDLKIK